MIAELLNKLRGIVGGPQQIAYDVRLGKRFAALLPNLSPAEVQKLRQAFLSRLSPTSFQFVPGDLLAIIQQIVNGMSPRVVCDPSAGVGAVLAAVEETVGWSQAYALTRNQSDVAIGKVLAPHADWRVGEPLELLQQIPPHIDLAVGIVPFGVLESRAANLRGRDGRTVAIRSNFAGVVLAAALTRLAADGVGAFVVQPSFVWSEQSVRGSLGALGFTISAMFALPPGIFAPATQMAAYLVVIDRSTREQMFIGQLTRDFHTNARLVENFRASVDTGTLELGRLVEQTTFRSFEALRLQEAIAAAENTFGAVSRPLANLALQINRRHSRTGSDFDPAENAVFIPLIGSSAVVTSEGDRTLKPHNYAQVLIDPTLSDARFVAHFFNSELGRQIRELNKTGTTIPQLNTQAIRSLPVLVPALETQRAMLNVQAQITAEETALLGLQNELSSMQRDLWRASGEVELVEKRIKQFTSRLSRTTREAVAQKLEDWFETLPFPLASILRAWQATESEDYRAKYEHLLHFFEATAELVGVIFLSAFKSSDSLYESHKATITETLQKMHLSFERATFGTWRIAGEYFGKQTRQLLGGDADSRSLCAELFSDASLALPSALSRRELIPVLSAANKMRNDWTGHGGVVSQDEAKLRNEQLKGEVQRLREALADVWREVHLIRALHCKPRTNGFETEVAVLMSSNGEFLKEQRLMSSFLYVDRLYLAGRTATRALELLPLVTLGPAPKSAKNACYFFNRLERTSARFVSYHFLDQPELIGEFENISKTIKSLTIQTDAPA